MYVKFWGTRGSTPTSISSEAIKEKIGQALEGAAGLDLTDKVAVDSYINRLPITVRGTMGGNTICLEVRSGNQLLILDAGSGIRQLGLDLMGKGFDKGYCHADILITHTHWDHIQGFPFFRPAFIPNNSFTFHSPFHDMSERLARQQHQDFFSVPVSYMSSKLDYKEIKENEWRTIGNFRVCPIRVSHPGESYIYRVEDKNSCLIYATDAEFKKVDPESTKRYIEFFQGADMLIFDAQYSLSETLDRPDWGHSTALIGAELAYRAGVKRLVLVHHDPTSSDEKIMIGKEQADAYLMRHYPIKHICKVIVGYDGLNLEI